VQQRDATGAHELHGLGHRNSAVSAHRAHGTERPFIDPTLQGRFARTDSAGKDFRTYGFYHMNDLNVLLHVGLEVKPTVSIYFFAQT
jgi:hypothetical protein